MTELSRGQNVPWPARTATVRVAGAGLDLSAFLLTAADAVRDAQDLVFYNAPDGPGVRWSQDGGQSLQLTLDQVPEEITCVRCVISVDPGTPALAQSGPLSVSVTDNDGQQLSFALTGLTSERALITVEVYRRAGAWKVRAVGQGWDGGLAEAVRRHGIDVDDEPGPHSITQAVPGPGQPVAGPPAPGTSGPGMAGPGPPDHDAEQVYRQASHTCHAILEDLGRSQAAIDAATRYAEHRLSGRLEEIVADRMLRGPAGDAQRADAYAARDDVVRRAQAQHDADLAQLGEELRELEPRLPASLARLDSRAWVDPIAGQDCAPYAVRLGSLCLPSQPRVKVPMVFGFPSRPLMWVDVPGERPDGVRFARSLIARLSSCSPPGSLRTDVVDMTGALSGQLQTGTPVDLRVYRSGTEAARLVGELVHDLEMVSMALDSGDRDLLAEMLSGRGDRLVVINDFPIGLDQSSLAGLARLAEVAQLVRTQLLLVTSDVDPMSRPDDPAIPAPVGAVISPCLWIGSSDRVPLSDAETGTAWRLDPELEGHDQAVTVLLSAGRIG